MGMKIFLNFWKSPTHSIGRCGPQRIRGEKKGGEGRKEECRKEEGEEGEEGFQILEED
jgi:hypothetical protein